MIHKTAFGVLIVVTISTMGYWDDSPMATTVVIVSGVCLWGLICWHSWWSARRAAPTDDCLHCGYNLTGNVSRRCPECGREVGSTVSSDHSFTLDPRGCSADHANRR